MSEMTWTEIEPVMKERPVALLPVGTTFAHGPHLPISTDTAIATEMAKRGAAKLRAKGIHALIVPPITYSVAEAGLDFPGTVSLPAEAVALLVKEICVALGKRFRAVALVNMNLEPQQVEALKKGADEATKAGASVCFTDITKKRWADMIGPNLLAGDHAGASETSLMMVANPGLVNEKTRISLPPVEDAPSTWKNGFKSLTEVGAEDAYSGDPTAASREEGEALFEVLSKILSLSVMEHLGSK